MMDFFHYVISAEQATERRNKIIEHFKQWGIEPNFFQAIMGNKLSEKQLQQLTNDEGLLTKGEIGCALSHLGVYRKLLESQEKCVFIFEDDARLNQKFFALMPAIKNFMEEEQHPAVLILYKVKAHTKQYHPLNETDAILRATAGSAAHGYVINRKAAENILNVQTPLKFEIDAWAIYQKLNLLRIYCTDCELVYLDEEQAKKSVIDQISTRKDRSPSFVKKIKDRHVEKIYNGLSRKEKMMVQLKRLQRHIQELYYDDNEK